MKKTLPIPFLPALALALATLLAGCAQQGGTAAPPLDSARLLFERFVMLGNDYDTTIADLYAAEARIVLLQQRDNGEVRRVSVAGSDFKDLVSRILPEAAKAGERNTYSDVTYSVRGNRIRIDALRTAFRTAKPEGIKVPHILVVGPSPQGEWLIYEEVALTPL